MEQSKGDSLRRQVENAKKFAEEMGWEYRDDLSPDNKFADKGVSGFTGDNLSKGKLGQFIELIKSGRVKPGSILLVESLDRISRLNPIEVLPIFLEIISSGVSIATVMDKEVYSTVDMNKNPYGLIKSIIIMQRANEESSTKSERVSEAWEKKKAKAATEKLTAKCPTWLKLQADRKDFDVIEERAAIVRRIYNMALDGYGAMKIAMTLNEEGVPGFGLKNNGWHIPYVHKLLAYEAVTGRYVPHSGVGSKRKPCGDPVENYYPRIVSDEIFNAVQQKKAAYRHGAGGRHGHKFTNLFTKLCKCGYCGATMSFYSTTTKKSRYRYIACRDARRGVGCDKYATVEMGAFEELFFKSLSEIDVSGIM